MEAPMDALTLQQLKQQRVEEKINRTVFVVSPAGNITEHVCGPHGNELDGLQHGDSMVRWVNGRAQLSLHREREGYVFYEDLARADGQMDVYRNFVAAVQVRMRGGKIAGDVDQLYTKSIHARRAMAASGNTSGQVFVIGHGVVSGDEAKRERVAALLASAGVQTDDLPAAAPEKKVK